MHREPHGWHPARSEAESWDDDTVKANPFKRTVYLTANVKILNSMTDLIFPITMA